MTLRTVPGAAVGRRPGVIAAILVLATAFAVSWHFGVWLIVCAMAATAAGLVTAERIGERLAAGRVAVWALHVPHGPADRSAMEHLLAADLAAVAGGCRRLLHDSAAYTEASIEDPWVRALATERLRRAEALAAGQSMRHSSLGVDLVSSRTAQVSALLATPGTAMVAAATQHPVTLLAVAVCIAALGIGHGEARRRLGARDVLQDLSRIDPSPGAFVIPDWALVAALRSLAGSRRRVLERAATRIPDHGEPRATMALSRLTEATRGARGHDLSLTKAVVGWCGAAMVMVLGLGAL